MPTIGESCWNNLVKGAQEEVGYDGHAASSWNQGVLWARDYIEKLEKLLEVAKCPDEGCDGKGTVAVQVAENDWEAQQCQWCDEAGHTK